MGWRRRPPKENMSLPVLLLLATLITTCTAQSTDDRIPRITFVSPAQTVVENSSLTLECQAAGRQPMQYQWYRDDTPLTQLSRDGTYSQQSIKRSRAGLYRCLARDVNGVALFSRSVDVAVSYIDEFNSRDTLTQYRFEATRNSFVVLRPPKLNYAPPNSIKWRWFYGDAVVWSNISHYISTHGELVLVNVQREQSGVYRVQATHGSLRGRRRVDSQQYYLQVVESGSIGSSGIEMALPPRNVEMALPSSSPSAGDNDLIVECVPSSSDASLISITWRHNSSVVTPDRIRYSIVENGRRLIVRNVVPSRDAGVYTCSAQMDWQRSEAHAQIIINAAPKNTRMQHAVVEARTGREVELPCDITALVYVPVPGRSPVSRELDARWYHNGAIVDNRPIGVNGGLQLEDVNDVDAKGVYQCVKGGAISTTVLKLRDQSATFFNSRSTNSPNSRHLSIGESFRLVCPNIGVSESTTWKLNGVRVNIDGRQISQPTSSSLLVQDAQSLHSGSYTCAAVASPSVVRASFTVTVAGGSLIARGPVDTAVVIGSKVTLPCELVDGVPNNNAFKRTWYYNDQLITPGTRDLVLQQNGALFIRQAEPARIGTYKCTVSTSIGTQSQQAKLSIIERPGLPLNVHAALDTSSRPSSVLVEWDAGFDGNSAIIKYDIEGRIWTSSADLWSDWEPLTENIGAAARRTNVENLRPSAVYQLRVVASNRFGAGYPSLATANITMPQQPPAAQPRNVAASARSSTSIMIQWQRPDAEQWNGDVEGYVVRYRLANYPGAEWMSSNVTAGRTNLLVDGLITWNEYEIKVSAFNERGAGVYSKSLYVRTMQGVPTAAPSNVEVTVIDSTSISVSFTPPQQQMIPGVNQGYKIMAWRGNTVEHRLEIPPKSFSRQTVSLTDLKKYTEYNISVVCYTQPGDGPHSKSVRIRTFEDVPGPLDNVHFEDVVHDSAMVVWNEPTDPNGRLLNYTLRYWRSTDALNPSSVTTKSVPSNTTKYIVHGLHAETDYTFELMAYTRAGRGEVTTVDMSSGVPPEPPTAPTNVRVSQVDSRSAFVEFTPGYDGKTVIRQWIVEGQLDDSSQWVTVFRVRAPKARSFSMDGLRPNTRYRLRLIAENVVARSPYSVPYVEIVTVKDVPEAAPGDVQVEPDGRNTLLVSWTPLGTPLWNGEEARYVIAYRARRRGDALNDVQTNQWIEHVVTDPSASSARIVDLRPFERYEVRLACQNEIGTTNMTESVEATTYEDVPDAAPQRFTANAMSSTSIKLNWGDVPTRARNGRLIGYTVYCASDKPRACPSDKTRIYANDESKREFVLDGLSPFTKYKLQLAARTIVGDGIASQPIVTLRTMQDVPGSPSAVKFHYVAEDYVRLQWAAPFTPNGQITQYRVTHWLNDTFSSHNNVSVPIAADLTSYTASRLTPRTWYTFLIEAQTVAGWGQGVQLNVYTTNHKTSAPTPSRPSQAPSSSYPPRSSGIHAQWTAAAIGLTTAPVRLFHVEYSPANQGQWVRWEKTAQSTGDGGVQTVFVDGLAANTAYRLRVRAVNDISESSWSKQSDWMQTLEDVPTSPALNVTAEPFNSNSMKIVWTPAESNSWHSAHVGYKVLYQPYNVDGEDDSTDDHARRRETEMRADETERSVVVDGLRRFAHYIVFVQPFNGRGVGPRSRPAFVYVGYSIPKTEIQDATARAVSSTEIELRWASWPQQAEPIQGFRIRYTIDGEDDWTEAVWKQGGDVYTLRGLKKYAKYVIDMAPFNKAGIGPVRRMEAATAQDFPGIVGVLKFSDVELDSVNVSWTSPTSPNGVLRMYRVNYKTHRASGHNQSRIIDVKEHTRNTWFTATNLDMDAVYEFTVAAETQKGPGAPRSATVKVGPVADGAPIAPKSPRIHANEQSLTLRWTNGKSVGRAPISGYIIQAKRVASRKPVRGKGVCVEGRWCTLHTIDGHRPTHTMSLTELQPLSEYEFRVFARNRLGVGFPSPATQVFVTPETVALPFYYDWRFLLALVLLALLFFFVVVAVLCWTGRKVDYDGQTKGRRGGGHKKGHKHSNRRSIDSLSLADGGVVTYEMHRAKKARQPHNQNMIVDPPRPNPLLSQYNDEQPQSHAIMHSTPTQHRRTNQYGVIDNDSTDGGFAQFPIITARTSSQASTTYNNLYSTRLDDRDTSTTGESSDSVEDRTRDYKRDSMIDGASIVNHYTLSAHDRERQENWRKAKQSAARETTPAPSVAGMQPGGGGLRHTVLSSSNSHRPPSHNSVQSEVQHTPHAFSSFV